MEAEEANEIILGASSYDYGKFYGAGIGGQPLGVGQIFQHIRYPLIDQAEMVYDTVEGYVYVLTHECDVSAENLRTFNEFVLICPILSLEACAARLSKELTNEQLTGLFNDIGRDRVNRVTFFPALEGLPYGGILYLNHIAYTHTSAFELANAEAATSVTAYGLRIIDYKITNHLLRPKSASLPLMEY